MKWVAGVVIAIVVVVSVFVVFLVWDLRKDDERIERVQEQQAALLQQIVKDNAKNSGRIVTVESNPLPIEVGWRRGWHRWWPWRRWGWHRRW